MSATTGDPAAGAGGFEEAPLSAAALILRIVAALVIVVIAGWLFSVLFAFLRSRDANRFLVVLVAIGIGIGGVFFLFWGMNKVVDWLPAGFREGVRPYVFVGPRPRDPQRVPGLSGVQHDPDQPQGLPRAELRRPGQLQVRVHRSQHAPFDPQHGGVDGARSARRREHRPRLRNARRPAPSRRGDRQVHDLPADGDLVRRGGDHVPVDLQLPASGVRVEHRTAQRHHARARQAARRVAPATAVEQPVS